MKKPPPAPPPSGNEGYGSYGNYGYGAYSGSYYGYGYGYGSGPGGGDAQPTRTLRDYLLILRERIWWFIVTFLVVFIAFFLYAQEKTPEYVSTTTVQIFRSANSAVGHDDPNSEVMSAEDFQTRVTLLESATVAGKVAESLTDKDRKQLLAPYEDHYAWTTPPTVMDRLILGRGVDPVRLTLVIRISFQHPDKELAAKIANAYADAFIESNIQNNADTARRSVGDLSLRVENARKEVDRLQTAKDDMVKKYGFQIEEGKANIEDANLQRANQVDGESKQVLDVAQNRWEIVQDQTKAGKALWDLSFIAAQTQVNKLLTDLTTVNTELATEAQILGPEHPTMKALVRQQAQIEHDLTVAVESAAQTIYNDFVDAQRNYETSHATLADIEKNIQTLSEVQMQYDSLARQFEEAVALGKQLQDTMAEKEEQFNLQQPQYHVIDPAVMAQDPAVPRKNMLYGLGFVGGLLGGLGLAFLVAFLDDRIKTAFDIESVVGLSLLGILPRVRHLSLAEKAQAVATNSNRRLTESFRSIYSTLKLNDASKNARIMLITSTVPSEGKSFVATNLALTYATHGERVLLIDCDLRMPNIAASLGLEKRVNGLISHLVDKLPLEECLLKDFFPNLDVLVTGGKTRNPTQIFNSREFSDFMAQMRQQYDRIFVDSPPVGAVSDALNLLSNVDGVLYVIKFNSVNRKTAKLNLRRLLEGNVPVFGAVLNQISLSVASYYYTSYYDKSYHNYYVHDDEEETKESAPAALTPDKPPADAS